MSSLTYRRWFHGDDSKDTEKRKAKNPTSMFPGHGSQSKQIVRTQVILTRALVSRTRLAMPYHAKCGCCRALAKDFVQLPRCLVSPSRTQEHIPRYLLSRNPYRCRSTHQHPLLRFQIRFRRFAVQSVFSVLPLHKFEQPLVKTI